MRPKTHKLAQYLAPCAFSATMRHQTIVILTLVSDSTLLSYPTLHLYVFTYFPHQSECFNSSILALQLPGSIHLSTNSPLTTLLPSASAFSAYPRSVTCITICNPYYYLRSVRYERVPAVTDPDQVRISISHFKRVPVSADRDPCYSLPSDRYQPELVVISC